MYPRKCLRKFSSSYRVPVLNCLYSSEQVVNLEEMPSVQKEKVYMRFAKELFILSKLRHPRVVTLICCTTSLAELTLIMEYMPRGSLRSVLTNGTEWATYTPAMRSQILLDAAEALAFLHANDLFHRDLKRYVACVLRCVSLCCLWSRALNIPF